MSTPRFVLAAAAAVLPAACGPLSAEERPAVVVMPTAASRAELARVVSTALNGQPVALADDALTSDSLLMIQRRTPPGEQGRAATGRTLDAPEQFRLVLRGTRCLLVHVADGREWELAATRCAAAPVEPR